MKKKLLGVLSCLVICLCFLLTGCSKLAMPAADGKIVGNGGTVVQKGEYIYFANAYTDYSAIGDDISNKTGNAGVYSLYRAKTTNGGFELDDNGMVKNAEVIVEKVVGFEYSNLYIIGDYLYFSSPNMHKTSSNQNKYDLISVFKVKLDGTGLDELYTTQKFSGDWKILNFDTKNYVLTVEEDQIVRHEIDKSGKMTNKTILAENVTDAILPENNNYSNDKYAYFTTARSEQDTTLGLTGNYLKRVNIINGEIKDVHGTSGETYSLLTYQNGNLIYSKSTAVIDARVYANDFENPETNLIQWSGATNLNVVTVMGQGQKLVYTYNSKLVIQDFGSYNIDVLVDGNATVINVADDYLYYTLDGKISRVSLITNQSTSIYEDSNMEDVFDFDGRYIYLFTQAKNNSSNTKYMHRIDTFAIEQDVEVTAQPLGVFKSNDSMIEDAE